MRWRRKPRSRQLEDRRGGGGRGGLPLGRMGIPGLVILVLGLLFGRNLLGDGDLGQVLEGLPAAPGVDAGEPIPSEADPDAELVDFLSFVLDDAQVMWEDILRRSGETYRRAELVLFSSGTSSGCGVADAGFGPHYCPADEKVYIDLGFFEDLRDRFGAPGDFAQAYVLAHEIGHHVQNVLGISDDVRAQQEEDPGIANALSVKLELQADCFAGVWAYTTYERDLLDSGDLDEGLAAAAAVGDDRLQRAETGSVNRETWTHGSSEQRSAWLKRGFETGAPAECDTFAG